MTHLPLVIEPEQLAAHLGEPDLLVIDLSSADNYAAGHIPGAINVDPKRLLCGEGPVPNKLPSADQLSALFSEIGLNPQQQVVVYDDQKGPWAGRMIWTLAIAGHDNASFLNGHFAGWVAAGQAIETDANQPTPSEFKAAYDTGLVVDIPWILSHLDNGDLCVWDARGGDEYRGEKVTNAQVGGHIPGARLLEWTDLLEAGPVPRLKDQDTVRQLVEDAGIDAGKTIITHCQTHRRSGLTWLVGRWLGLDDIRCYDGSWFEWGNTPDLPVER